MRWVLDSNVVVAGMRSPTGASAFLLRAARQGRIQLLANVALALEYEAVCKRPEHVLASGLSWGEVDIFLTAVVSMVEPVTSHFLWRPHLRDPSDEMVLEAAVNGQATAIITFNPRDFAGVAAQFGIDILPPRDGSRRLTS